MGFVDNTRLARMSDGHYCLVRDLGPVKGGKGIKHHDVVVDFSFRGMIQLFRQLSARLYKPSITAEVEYPDIAPEGLLRQRAFNGRKRNQEQ
jgi:hypothetical protein